MIDERHPEIREAVRALCAGFPDEYFRRVDAERAYPDAFVDALIRAGWLAAMIPEAYGGAGLGLSEASVILEEINRCGGNAGAVHGQMYSMGTLLRHGSEAQKRTYLPRIVDGQKVFISRVRHSDFLILLARTTPLAELKKRSEGLSIFMVDLREAVGRGLVVRPIANLVNHETNATNISFAYVAEHVLGLPRSY